jgi:hypothetical protein
MGTLKFVTKACLPLVGGYSRRGIRYKRPVGPDAALQLQAVLVVSQSSKEYQFRRQYDQRTPRKNSYGVKIPGISFGV